MWLFVSWVGGNFYISAFFVGEGVCGERRAKFVYITCSRLVFCRGAQDDGVAGGCEGVVEGSDVDFGPAVIV